MTQRNDYDAIPMLILDLNFMVQVAPEKDAKTLKDAIRYLSELYRDQVSTKGRNMTAILTDELVEKFRAFLLNETGDTVDLSKHVARAAILAVLPDIVEACAREYEKAVVRAKSGDSAYDLAGAIRALAGLSFQDGKKQEKATHDT